MIFPIRSLEDVLKKRVPGDGGDAMDVSRELVEDVRTRGEAALREGIERFGEAGPDGRWLLTRDDLRLAWDSSAEAERVRLRRIAARIESFARAQRDSVTDLNIPVPGGRAGHTVVPVGSVGAYAPGGRYPLPSSVLMTVIPAKVAGVEDVWACSPNPAQLTLAAAWIAGADHFLCAGGAHAIAALGWGCGKIPACDVVVGPGNRYVAAAKQLLDSSRRIDIPAGPSELVVLADVDASVSSIAADLLAQAEHDPDAWPVLVTPQRVLADAVQAEIEIQLADLSTADVARAALQNGGVLLVDDLAAGAALCDRLAPEHLELQGGATAVGDSIKRAGTLFVGGKAAEVFGDYGAGPNHVLPTGGASRAWSGLSVLSYLRWQTWLSMDNPAELIPDTVWLARQEGLEAHARAAEARAANSS